MNLPHAIIISILQGVSELFPVSSLGHAVILPKLLRWGIDEKAPSWLAFLVALHLGTAIALLIYFRDEWIAVARAFVRSIQSGQISQDDDQRLAWMVLAGTVPAGVVGLALQDPLRSLFSSAYVAAAFLIVNGLIMYLGEKLLRQQNQVQSGQAQLHLSRVAGSRGPAYSTAEGESFQEYRDITLLSWRDAAIVGFAQVGALIPGISRSGITMVAGLGAGLTHEAAARYAFLLSTPIIGAAGVLEVPKLFEPAAHSVVGYAAMGMVLAGIAAYISVRYLMRYFELGTLYPFAYYCWTAGSLSLLLLKFA